MLEQLFDEYKNWIEIEGSKLAPFTKDNYVSVAYEKFQSQLYGLSNDILNKANENDLNALITIRDFLEENRLSKYKRINFGGITRFEDFIINKIESINDPYIGFEYHKKQIILQGPPGTGKTRQAKDLAYQLIFKSQLSTDSLTRRGQLKELENNSQFKLIQFHPAYSYEDFVRGITAKSNGNSIEYKTEDKVLALLAKAAHENYLDSQKEVEVLSKELWIKEMFQDYVDDIQDKIDKESKIQIGDTTTYIIKVDKDAFRYKGDNWDNSEKGHKMKFSDLLQLFEANIETRQDIKKLANASGSAKQHASYFIKVLDDFKEFIKGKTPFQLTQKQELKNYVLIIDEINRANLPAVLGELIYALEYRGEAVASMYDIDGDTKIILPPNLYIIGTMNTADRSVGHIDYAIRRRFAFVDVLPDAEVVTNPIAKEVFAQIQTLFEEHTAADFNVKDVALGHSYFIVKDDSELKQKLTYEVLPILHEYIKDGVLNKNEFATAFIADLKRKTESLGA